VVASSASPTTSFRSVPPPFAIAAEVAHLSFRAPAKSGWCWRRWRSSVLWRQPSISSAGSKALGTRIAGSSGFLSQASSVGANSTSVHNDLRARSVGCMLYLLLALARANWCRRLAAAHAQFDPKAAWRRRRS
jgi:hypothetical protein